MSEHEELIVDQWAKLASHRGKRITKLRARIQELEEENAKLREQRKPRTYTCPGFRAEDPLAGVGTSEGKEGTGGIPDDDHQAEV